MGPVFLQLQIRRIIVIGVEGNITLTSVSTKNLYVASVKKGHLAKKCHKQDKTGTRKSLHSKSMHHIGTGTDKKLKIVYTQCFLYRQPSKI